jgi:CheY-like chemotaxis protein
MEKSSNGLSALLCEDDAAIRDLIETVLSRDGFDVSAVCDGTSAVAQLENDEFDLIVLDLMMPGLNGFDVIDFLKTHQPRRLKRVMITTAVPPALAAQLPSTICHVLPKPFDIEKLLEFARSCSEDTLTRRSRELLPIPSAG